MKNPKKLKPERMKQLLEIEKALTGTLELVQNVISGSITLSEMIRTLGYNETHSSELISQYLSPYFNRKNLLKSDEMLEILKDTASPYEKIANAIFLGTKNKCAKNKLLVLNPSEEKIIADAIESTMSDREKEVLFLRYGFYEEYPDGLSLGEIAKLRNCTQENIRQVEAKALRKLRNPELYYDLFPEYKDCIVTLQDMEYIITAKDFVSQESRAIYDLCNSIRSHMILLQMHDDVKALNQGIADKYKIRKIDCPTSNAYVEYLCIEHLHLSPRAYNALKSHGCYTIHDVTSLTKRKLTRMSGLGKVSVDEIIDALVSYGLSLKK